MISVSDILKLLDQVPVWKAVTGLPKRVKELEERVAALEAKPVVPEKSKPACPLCDAPMRVTAVRPDADFGDMGIQQHTLACTECSHTETRIHDPNGRIPSAGC